MPTSCPNRPAALRPSAAHTPAAHTPAAHTPAAHTHAAHTRAALALACLSALAAAGCDGFLPVVTPEPDPDPAELEPDAAQDGLYAPHDVDAQILPLPSDLYRQGGVIVRPPVNERTPLEAAVLDRLAGRDGWPLDAAVFIPVSAPLADGTGPDVARVFDLATQESVPFSVELEPRGVRLVPSAALRRGHTYVYALLTSAESAEGDDLRASESFAVLRSREPLDDREEEALRLVYAPWFLALEQRGVDRSAVAMIGAFTTTTAPGVRFDVRTRDLPYPSRFLVDDNGNLDIPAGAVDERLEARLPEYDGFSTTAPVRFAATAPLDPDTTFAPEGLRLLRQGPPSSSDPPPDGSPPSLTPVEGLTLSVLEQETALLTPEVALEGGADHVLVVGAAVSSAGVPLEPGLQAMALLSDDELFTASSLGPPVPAVRIFAAADAAVLEPARVDLAPVRDLLRAEPAGLDGAVHLQPFTTLDARALAKARRQRLYDEEVTVSLDDVVVATPAERGLWLLLPNVETIVSGTLTTQDWLDPLTRADRPEGPVLAPIHFVLNVPEGVPAGTPVPVVLFGHGLITTRELVYLVADFLAEAGFASLAIDFPYHGERSVCLSDANCPGESRCSVQGVCVDDAGDPVPIGAIESFWPNGPRIPPTTGLAFIEIENLMASRDHIVQGLVDLAQAVRVVRGVDWESTAGVALDGDDIVYLGISLGGIMGAALAGIEEHIGSFALNVPGAGLVELMQDSDTLSPVIDTYLDENDLAVGSPAFVGFESDAKWALDPADPINLAPREGKRLLIQMAVGDAVVPNSSTYRLGAATGVTVEEFTPAVLGHGFLGDPTELESGRAREQILEFYAGR